MAAEDIVQIQDIGYAKIQSAGGVVVTLAKSGAIASITGAAGLFTLNLTAGDGLPNDETLIEVTPQGGETGAGGMASVSMDQSVSTDVLKRFKVYGDDRTAPIDDWAFIVVLRRIENQR